MKKEKEADAQKLEIAVKHNKEILKKKEKEEDQKKKEALDQQIAHDKKMVSLQAE